MKLNSISVTVTTIPRKPQIQNIAAPFFSRYQAVGDLSLTALLALNSARLIRNPSNPEKDHFPRGPKPGHAP